MIQLFEDSITIEKLPKERFNITINHDTTITGQVINALMSIIHTEPKAFTSIGDIWQNGIMNSSNEAIEMLGLPPFSSTCETCMLVKSTLLLFSVTLKTSTKILIAYILS
ncbi:hypothetical protein O181_049455 [Austropuccinia psidii MF-1]|uniref:Uncharacterized protein n=1 Tax=Austropuccinia psidii MF-1 TaxID=1389203 RepID=A0A9Q3HQ27_9BASI|nr:hypothetical protein [Austropuccinia psidii MF-1]